MTTRYCITYNKYQEKQSSRRHCCNLVPSIRKCFSVITIAFGISFYSSIFLSSIVLGYAAEVQLGLKKVIIVYFKAHSHYKSRYRASLMRLVRFLCHKLRIVLSFCALQKPHNNNAFAKSTAGNSEVKLPKNLGSLQYPISCHYCLELGLSKYSYLCFVLITTDNN